MSSSLTRTILFRLAIIIPLVALAFFALYTKDYWYGPLFDRLPGPPVLREGKGDLYIRSVPDGMVISIDDSLVGLTNLDIEDLQTGEHDITISPPPYDSLHQYGYYLDRYDYYAQKKRVDVVAGGLGKPVFDLEHKKTKVIISTEPQEAEIWIDDRKIDDTTPVIIDSIETGLHSIRIVKAEYVELESTFVVDDKHDRLFFSLQDGGIKYEDRWLSKTEYDRLMRVAEIKQIGRDSWLKLGSYDDDPNYGGLHDFRSYFMERIISYKTIEYFSGMKKYVDTPASKKYALKHVNPELIKWCIRYFIPNKSNKVFIQRTQNVYDQKIRTRARFYYIIYVNLHKYRALFNETRRQFMIALENEKKRKYVEDNMFYGRTYRYSTEDYEPYYAFSTRRLSVPLQLLHITPEYLKDYDIMMPFDIHYPGYNREQCIWFWMKRSGDGTDKLLIDGLTQLMEIYDPAFLDKVNGITPVSSN